MTAFLRSFLAGLVGAALFAGGMPQASGAPLADLARLEAFNVTAFGDFTGRWSDVEGAIAAGGAVRLDGYSVGARIADPAAPAVVAGGAVVYSNGWSNGHAVWYGDAVHSAVAPYLPSTHRADVLDFAGLAAAAAARSDAYAGLSATGTASMGSGGVFTLRGVGLTVEIFDVAAAELASAREIVFDAAAGAKMLINVSGDAASLAGVGFSFANGAQGAVVLLNLPEAERLAMRDVGLGASGLWTFDVLAPVAAVDFVNGVLHGHLVAASVGGSGATGQFDLPGTRLFEGFPEAGPPASVDEPAGLVLLGAGLIGFWAIQRARRP